MLDVHAPEHPISGRREFFVHLFTITIGLLIALGLENAAEAVHHRHQRREAEANIRGELRRNRDLLRTEGPRVIAERDVLLQLLAVIELRSTGATPPPNQRVNASFHEAPIPDAAWRTASSTGVLNYMEYDEVERFADAYKQQDMLQTAEEQALESYLEFTPILPNKDGLTVEQAKDALPYVRLAVAHLDGMLALGEGTLESYNSALK